MDATGYFTERLENGALAVYDVPLMGTLSAEDLAALLPKGAKPQNNVIDEAWLNRAVARANEMREAGKLPLLFRGHNEPGKAAQVIGRLDQFYVAKLNGEPWLFCKRVIITDAQAAAEFEAGKFPSKSVEFQPDADYVRGLALLEGKEGRFDFGIPDFVPRGYYEKLNAEQPEGALVLCAKPGATGGHTMDLEKLNATLNSIAARLEKLEKREEPGEDPLDALADVRAKAAAQIAAAKAAADREAKLEKYAARLSAKLGVSHEAVLNKLSTFTSDEAIDVYYDAAMKTAASDVKLASHEFQVKADLKAEHAAFLARRGLTEAQFPFQRYEAMAQRADMLAQCSTPDAIHAARGEKVYAIDLEA